MYCRSPLAAAWVDGRYNATKFMVVKCRLCPAEIVSRVDLEAKVQYEDICVACIDRHKRGPRIGLWRYQYQCMTCKKHVRLPVRFKYVVESGFCSTHYAMAVSLKNAEVPDGVAAGAAVGDAIECEETGEEDVHVSVKTPKNTAAQFRMFGS
jgi:hypothetical protein